MSAQIGFAWLEEAREQRRQGTEGLLTGLLERAAGIRRPATRPRRASDARASSASSSAPSWRPYGLTRARPPWNSLAWRGWIDTP